MISDVALHLHTGMLWGRTITNANDQAPLCVCKGALVICEEEKKKNKERGRRRTNAHQQYRTVNAAADS